jgi:WD40 repeat protein
MNIFYYRIVIIVIHIGQLCFTMENPQQENLISTINTIPQPQFVICFSHNIVALAGKKECHIYQFFDSKKFSHYQEIKRIKSNKDIVSIAKHPHKPLLAILSQKNIHQKYLKIYDVMTGKKIAQLSPSDLQNPQNFLQKPIIFCPHDDTIIIRCNKEQLCIFDYNEHENDIYNPQKNDLNNLQIAFNPKQEKHIIYHDLKIELHSSISLFASPLTKPISTKLINAIIHSSDGSLALLNCFTKGFYIYETNTHNMIEYNSQTENNALSISPINFILATISKNKCVLFWNIKQPNSLLARINLTKRDEHSFFYPHIIDFFCDGTKLFLVQKNKYLILETPFDALYVPGSKSKCIFVLYILQYCCDCENNPLPIDMKRVILHYFLNCYKYSFDRY